MKNLLTIITCIFLTSTLFGKNDKDGCYVLRVANKKFLADTSLLQPQLYLQGFYLTTNGVYDLEINGNTFMYYRIHAITHDSVYASYVFDTIPTLSFSMNDKICILLNTCYDGRCGFPNYTKVKSNKYQFKILPTNNYCSLQNIKVYAIGNVECVGFQYLTGAGLVPIY